MLPLVSLRRVIKFVVPASAGLLGYYIYASNGYVETGISPTGIIRFGRAAVAISRIVVDYKLHFPTANQADLMDENGDIAKLKSVIHTRSAERLRDMCCENGGCFIKVGQHLGSLDYLLPEEYVKTMKVLQRDAPLTPIEDVKMVIEKEFGVPWDHIFSRIEHVPIGSASLAQVHRAFLKDGSQVAVKVQHPFVKAHSFLDIVTMELLVKLVARIFPDFKFMWLAEETEKNLPLELDFIHEGKNAEKISKVLKKFTYLKVPQIYWTYSTPRVLTMEFLDGVYVDDVSALREAGISTDDVSRKLGMMYSEMIFVQGYIHCDPHPGNILVRRKDKATEIVLLDHGLYQTLTDDHRLSYCRLWRAMLSQNIDHIRREAEALGCGDKYHLFACMVSGRSWNSVTQGIQKNKFTTEESARVQAYVAGNVVRITEVLNAMPREFLLIFKTNDLIRNLEHTFNTRSDTSTFITMSQCCLRALYEADISKSSSFLSTIYLHLCLRASLLRLSLYCYALSLVYKLGIQDVLC